MRPRNFRLVFTQRRALVRSKEARPQIAKDRWEMRGIVFIALVESGNAWKRQAFGPNQCSDGSSRCLDIEHYSPNRGPRKDASSLRCRKIDGAGDFGDLQNKITSRILESRHRKKNVARAPI